MSGPRRSRANALRSASLAIFALVSTTCLAAAPVPTSRAAAAEVASDPGAARGPAVATPVSDAQATLGRTQFEAVCGACHGANGRGGRNGAPDLLTSPVALADAAHFREFVRAGSVARGMPAFPLDDATLDAIHAHVSTLAAAARRRGDREIALVGDPVRGRAYFDGAGGCAACHSIDGDLKGIGARYTPRVLQGRIVMPRGAGIHPGLLQAGFRIPGLTDRPMPKDAPRTVRVTFANGEYVEGTLVAISDFDVALREADGRHRSFGRRGPMPRVEIHDPAQAHVDRLGRWNDRDLHDVTAFLAGVK